MIQVCDPPRQRQVRRLSAEEFFTLVRCGGAGFYRPCSEVLRMLTAGEAWGTPGAALLVLPLTADTAAAVTEHAHDAAVLPVRFPFFIGEFKHAEQVVGSVGGNLKFHVVGVGRSVFSFLLDVGHEAGPGASFELIQQGSWMFDCHCLTSTWFGW